MNWAALRHLCWVLLILNGVSGSEEEQFSRPTTPVRLRRPIRRNSIKKSSEDGFKPSIFPDDPSSTTGSTRFTTKRTNAVDYLARNTVPVASVTEISRKPYRPPPAHLLTYQALSSTEKGSDRTNEPNLPPTGWALASLGPSKNSSSLISKKNNIPLGTSRPLTNYWSTRLRRPPALRTTPIPPVANDAEKSSEDDSGSAAVEIPSDNLIKYENNATASHPKLSGDFPSAAKELAPGYSNTKRENVLEKPSNTKKLETTTPSQTFQATTDNTRSNLIKELKGSDIGSKILHGIVAVTNASEYDVSVGHETEEKRESSTKSVESEYLHKPQDDTNVVDEHVQLVTRKSESGITPSVTKSSTPKIPLIDTTLNLATSSSEEVALATASASSKETFQTNTSTSSNDTTPTTTAVSSKGTPQMTRTTSTTETPQMTTSTSSTETPKITTSTSSKETPQMTTSTSSKETPQITTSTSSKETPQITTSTSSKETPQMTTTTSSKETSQSASSNTREESSQETGASLFPPEESKPESELPTDKRKFTDRITTITESADDPKEIMSTDTTLSESTTGDENMKEISSVGKLEEANVSTPFSTVTETEAAITTTSVSESSLVPIIANMTSLSQDDLAVNKTSENISEAQKVTTLPSVQDTVSTATTVSQEINDIPEAYTRFKNNPYIEKSSSEGSDEVVLPTSTPLTTKVKPHHWDETSKPSFFGTSPKSTTSATFGSTKTTTELMDSGLPTSTPSILETTTTLPVLKNGSPDPENETAMTWGTLPATEVSKEEVTSRSSVEMPTTTATATTTMKIQVKTTARSGQSSSSDPAITESFVVVAETTTIQYDQRVNHTDIRSSTSTEYVHIEFSEKPEDDHDDTLKYNVTTVDHPHGNGTEPDESDEDSEDDTEKESDVQTTTTLVIIEEITTSKPTTTRPTTVPMPTSKTTTQPPSSTTTRHSVDQDVLPPTTGKTPESSSEPRLRLTFQASFKEMCLVRDSLAETIAAYFKSVSTRPIQSNQVKILNLGMAECASKSLPLTEKVPVFVQITDAEGKGDQNLTEILYSYIKQSPFNFKYQLAHVEHGQKPLIMEEDNQWGGTVIAAIIISSVAGVSLLVLTILLVIMRKRQKGFTYGQRCTPVSLEDYSLDNISVFNSVRRKARRASKRSYGNPAFDDPVTVNNPLNFVGLSNMANSHQKIDNEYSEVPTVTVKPDELPPGAESKNRYANVIPIPETRVPVKGPDGEDLFINANHVKGVKGTEKFYIACQAPLESTIADFWLMIWEQQSQVILMLTDLHENGVEKCADYLPPSEVLDCHRVFGDLQVTLKKREVREKYIISSLQLRNLESNLWREVIHLWYTGWPIRGVPSDLTSIIAYLIEARSYSKPGHPIVVHCSPGTGRTGTVIAIDIAIRDFETDRTVDIPKTVYGIRRDRAGAVQTNLQYYMIYQVIHLYATKLTGGSLDSI